MPRTPSSTTPSFDRALQVALTRNVLLYLDGRLAQQYEAKLQQSLQELREQQEANIKANRDEIEALYENKVTGQLL